MSLPDNLLSSSQVIGNFLAPDTIDRTLLRDYERGGIAVSDGSQGLLVQDWTLQYTSPDMILSDEAGNDTVLFSFTGITEVGLAFTQNMSVFVTYVMNDRAWYYWYDPTAMEMRHVQMEAGVTSPRCCLDDKRPSQSSVSDIILAYVKDKKLYMRIQRDRYEVEYILASGMVRLLNRVGMGDNLRLHFQLQDGSEYIPPSTSPPEITLPYWDNLEGNGWIDLTKTINQSFSDTFGAPIEGIDFESVHAVGTGLAPIASLVNTVDGGNRFILVGDDSFTEAVIILCEANGNVLDWFYYDPAVGSVAGYVEVPTGGNYYLVTASDTGNARVRKWDISNEHDIIDPDISGAVLWDDWFGQPFGTVSQDMMKIIPAGGIALAFTVPITSDQVAVKFSTVENTNIATTRTGSISQTVGDYSAYPWFIWGNGGGIRGLINIPADSSPEPTILLVPGQTYVWNVKNDSPTANNWIRLRCSYRVATALL